MSISRPRWLSVILMLMFCMSLMFAGSTAAAPKTVTKAPAIQTNTGGSCVTSLPYGDYTYHTNSSPSVSRSGVAADIDIDTTGFDACTTSGGLDAEGPSAFIELQPRCRIAGCASDGSGWSTIRLGIVECKNGTARSYYPCYGDENPHYFFTSGGCNGYETSPEDWENAGVADTSSHHYEIYDTGSGTIKGTIDGVTKFTFSKTGDSGINCWIDENLSAQWGAYRLDLGDSTGTNSTHNLLITSSRYGLSGLGWFDPSWANGPCQHKESTDETCTLSGGDNITDYTSS